MYKQTFFSFHYADVNRAMIVRNSWVPQGVKAAGFADKAEFEQLKRTNDEAVKRWIDKQIEGTTVTVVLIGSETLDRKFVQYEIQQSLNRGNAIVGVKINNLKDMKTLQYSRPGNTHTVVGYYNNGSPIYFDSVCDGIYDYYYGNGYENLGSWINDAAKKHGR